MERTISIVVKGKVQGVFYRQSARETAQAMGITGSVRNQPDGTVNIIASGPGVQLEKFLEWCRIGPPRAIIKSVDWREEALQHFADFRIVR